REQPPVERQHLGVRRAGDRLPAQLRALERLLRLWIGPGPNLRPLFQEVEIFLMPPLTNGLGQRGITVAGEVVERSLFSVLLAVKQERQRRGREQHRRGDLLPFEADELTEA